MEGITFIFTKAYTRLVSLSLWCYLYTYILDSFRKFWLISSRHTHIQFTPPSKWRFPPPLKTGLLLHMLHCPAKSCFCHTICPLKRAFFIIFLFSFGDEWIGESPCSLGKGAKEGFFFLKMTIERLVGFKRSREGEGGIKRPNQDLLE